jgi:adenylate cyclase
LISHEEALAVVKRGLDISPNIRPLLQRLAIIYSLTGRDGEAGAVAENLIKLHPKFSIERWAKRAPFKDQAVIERYVKAMRKAGLPDKPSIAVLPFTNMSEDPKQEYFSDGLTEEIITALSKVPKLFVIARHSTFTYKGKPAKVQQVGRELGVRYVLEGSVRKAGDRVRITAQLVDATTGHHLWAERYDRDLKDIFAIQDEITVKIISALRVKLTEGEQAAFRIKSATNLDAYLKYLQAREYATDFNRDSNIKARKIAEEAIALDPNFQGGYSVLAQVELFDVWLRLSKSPKESFMRAVKLAKKAIAIEDSPEPHRTLAGIYVFLRKYDEAIAEGKKAIELDPNSANAHGTLGHVLANADMPQEAIPILERAIRLNPYPPSRYFHNLAIAYNALGKYEEAITAARKAVNIQPNDRFAHYSLIYSYSSLGREEEARAQAAELLRTNPKYCVRRGKGYFKNTALLERFRDALRKAGVPDCPIR